MMNWFSSSTGGPSAAFSLTLGGPWAWLTRPFPYFLPLLMLARVTVTLLPRVCNITTLIIQILSSGVMPSIRSPSANVLRAAVNSCSLAAAVSGSAAASTGSCCSARLAALLSWNR